MKRSLVMKGICIALVILAPCCCQGCARQAIGTIRQLAGEEIAELADSDARLVGSVHGYELSFDARWTIHLKANAYRDGLLAGEDIFSMDMDFGSYCDILIDEPDDERSARVMVATTDTQGHIISGVIASDIAGEGVVALCPDREIIESEQMLLFMVYSSSDESVSSDERGKRPPVGEVSEGIVVSVFARRDPGDGRESRRWPDQ